MSRISVRTLRAGSPRARCGYSATIGLAVACAATSGCGGAASATERRTVVRLAIGSPLLLDAYKKLMPDLSFEIAATGGSVTQLEALQNGSADVGNAMADVAYMASRGQLGTSSGRFDKLRRRDTPQ